MSNLYTYDGWLDISYIASRGAWANVIIGKRQVGKTYGVLKYMLDENIHHVLLRRTTAELETIAAAPDLSPYKVFEDYNVGLFKSGKKLCQIADFEIQDSRPIITNNRGIATSLAEISHIRGFSGSAFTDLVFDEFIPEKGVLTRKTEGDAFLNAYTTINGNRELEGLPPLRAWLLANTNNIDSPILEALNLTDDILYMQRKDLEEFLTPGGVYICRPESKKIADLRKETALIKQIGTKSDFYGMAIENRFSYDESPYIKTMSIKGMAPAWSYDNLLYCRSYPDGYYICRAPFKGGVKYDGNRTDRERLSIEQGIIKQFYYAGMVSFSDLRTLAIFKRIFNIA